MESTNQQELTHRIEEFEVKAEKLVTDIEYQSDPLSLLHEQSHDTTQKALVEYARSDSFMFVTKDRLCEPHRFIQLFEDFLALEQEYNSLNSEIESISDSRLKLLVTPAFMTSMHEALVKIFLNEKSMAYEIYMLCVCNNDEAAIEFMELLKADTNGKDYCHTWMFEFNEAVGQSLAAEDKLRHLYNRIMQAHEKFRSKEKNVIEAFIGIAKDDERLASGESGYELIEHNTLVRLDDLTKKISGASRSSDQNEDHELQQEEQRLQTLLPQAQQCMSQIESVLSNLFTFCPNSWNRHQFYRFANYFLCRIPEEAQSSGVFTIMENFVTVYECINADECEFRNTKLIEESEQQISDAGSKLGIDSNPDQFLEWSRNCIKLQEGIRFTDEQVEALRKLLQSAQRIQKQLVPTRFECWAHHNLYLKDLIDNLTEICDLIKINPNQCCDTSTQLDESRKEDQATSQEENEQSIASNVEEESKPQVLSADQQLDHEDDLHEEIDLVAKQPDDNVSLQEENENEQSNASNIDNEINNTFKRFQKQYPKICIGIFIPLIMLIITFCCKIREALEQTQKVYDVEQQSSLQPPLLQLQDESLLLPHEKLANQEQKSVID